MHTGLLSYHIHPNTGNPYSVHVDTPIDEDVKQEICNSVLLRNDKLLAAIVFSKFVTSPVNSEIQAGAYGTWYFAQSPYCRYCTLVNKEDDGWREQEALFRSSRKM